jgi:23S rRNA (guanosine2251-2'-O)-methyltransferase
MKRRSQPPPQPKTAPPGRRPAKPRPFGATGPRPDHSAGKPPAPAETVWGIHPLNALLRHRPEQVTALYVAPGRQDQRVRELLALAESHRITIHLDAPLPLAEPDAVPHQGVVARIKVLQPLTLAELLPRLAAAPAPPLVLALDSIQDPHNLGAIVRSAAAFGVSALIMPKDRSAPLTGTVMKASAGTLPLVEICQVTNLAAALDQLKQHGFWIYGAGGDAPQSLYDTTFSGPICLVVGNEQKGIRPLVRRHCDHLIAIPLAAGVESLNVAVATGIILATINQQQHRILGRSDRLT